MHTALAGGSYRQTYVRLESSGVSRPLRSELRPRSLDVFAQEATHTASCRARRARQAAKVCGSSREEEGLAGMHLDRILRPSSAHSVHV